MAVDVSDSEGSEKSKSDRHGVTVLDQDDERVPGEEEVLEFAEYLGIDLEKEQDLLWIAREGVVAPVPAPWKACTENGDDVFYFNFETGESIWDHPSDENYRQLLQDKRKEKAATSVARTSKQASADAKPSTDVKASTDVKPSTDVKASSDVKASTDVKPSTDLKPSSDLKASSDVKASTDVKDSSDVKAGASSASVAPKESENNKPAPAVSTKKEAEANGKKEPDPNSSISAAEESLSASLSVSESTSVDKPSSEADGKTVTDVASPSGVGLAGVGLGGAVGTLGPAIKEDKKCEASLEEIEEEDGLEVEGSRESVNVRSEAKGGIAGSSASELSEDFMSEGSPNSSFLAPLRRASNSIGDTLEFSVSAAGTSMTGEEPHHPHPLESEVASLQRSLGILQKIRESQREFLELLLNGNPGN